MSIEKRFWNKVNKDTKSGCWEWTAGQFPFGYGAIWINEIGNNELAHRYSWKLHNGEIPDGMFICHHCDNPKCVNPDHLFLGTADDNIKDAAKKNRTNKPKGEAHPKHKLTKGQVKLIKKEYNEIPYGYKKDYKISKAKEYGVTYWAISDVVYNRRWTHV